MTIVFDVDQIKYCLDLFNGTLLLYVLDPSQLLSFYLQLTYLTINIKIHCARIFRYQ